MFGIGRLIVGTSGSPGSLHALRYGEVLARAHDAALIPVLAWEIPGDNRGRIQPASELGRACQDLACQRLREALVAVWGEVPGDPLVQPHVERGPAGWVLVNLACQRLREALIAVWGEVPDDPLVQPHVERGPAGWVLVNLACRPDDVLVVGAGRRGALGRLAFSRVSGYCVAHAQCPVIAVPPPALTRELGRGRLAWAIRRRSLTPEQVLHDRDRPAA